MPTLEIGTVSAAKRHTEGASFASDSGFTLVELMVVITIIGLMASVVVLNLPPRSEDQGHAIERMAARLQLAADEAILTGQVTAVEISEDRYRLMVRKLGRWEQLTGPLTGYDVPDGVILSLTVDQEELKLATGLNPTIGAAPTLFFLPSGETQPFELMFERFAGDQTLSSPGFGPLKLVRSSGKD